MLQLYPNKSKEIQFFSRFFRQKMGELFAREVFSAI
jgi:hypothetical protein